MTEGIAAATAPVERAPLAWHLAPVGVALGSLCLGAIALGHRSLTTDEAASIVQARGSLGALLTRIVRDDPGQAGELLLLKLAAAIGANEHTVRAPSAVAVALAAGLLVVLGTTLLGRVGGVVAGVALAVNAGVIDASREVRPYALGLLGIVAITLLFVLALDRGGGWRWSLYAVVAAALPLAHPLAASVLVAHGAALITRRDRADLRRAGIALVVGTCTAGLLLTWMAIDRLDASDRTDGIDFERLGGGLAPAIGWNPVLLAAAIAGIVVLFRVRDIASGRWRGVLVASLIAAPVVATLLAAVALPVFAGRALVLCAPGLALAAGAAVPLLTSTRRRLLAGIAVLLLASAATIAVRLTTAPEEDWRSLAAAVKRDSAARETVVVVPERSRDAFAYYAPSVPVIRFVRGEGAWVAVVANTPAGAITAARPSVHTPTYALLRQVRYGNDLWLQHWIRP